MLEIHLDLLAEVIRRDEVVKLRVVQPEQVTDNAADFFLSLGILNHLPVRGAVNTDIILCVGAYMPQRRHVELLRLGQAESEYPSVDKRERVADNRLTVHDAVDVAERLEQTEVFIRQQQIGGEYLFREYSVHRLKRFARTEVFV